MCKDAVMNMACERPPRPLRQRRLGAIFIDVAATPPHEEGIRPVSTFSIHPLYAYRREGTAARGLEDTSNGYDLSAVMDRRRRKYVRTRVRRDVPPREFLL